MFKKIILLYLLFIYMLAAINCTAQPRHIFIPNGSTDKDVPDVENVIEGVGKVVFITIPIYTEADRKSKLIRYAVANERFTIVGANDSWYAIKLYNGRIAFVEKRNLSTYRIFDNEEKYGYGRVEKRLNVELTDMVNRFNETLQNSVYVNKFQIIPQLTFVSATSKDRKLTIIMDYCAVDIRGTIVPSRQNNVLQEELKDFVELIFAKMLQSMSDSYVIQIRMPGFSPGGKVLSTRKVYAQLVLEHKDMDSVLVRHKNEQDKRLLTAVNSDISADMLFKEFPN